MHSIEIPAVLLPDAFPFAQPSAALQLSVVVPVRNETVGLTRTLASLAHQIDPVGAAIDPATYEVLLLANNCTDDSAEVARCFSRCHPCFRLHVAEVQLPLALAHVGTARRLLMDAACRRLFQCNRPRGVVASTDGDTEAAPDWVFQTLHEIAAGADAVGGRISIKRQRFEDREARLYSLRDRMYQHGLTRLEAILDPDPSDPWPRHHQFFGGSLAVTAEAYCRVGGLPTLPCLEDVALEDSLRRLDAKVRHSPAVRVSTSARQEGRTPLGLSAQLREWGEMGRTGLPHRVQQPAAVEARLHARRILRHRRHGVGSLSALAEALAVPADILDQEPTEPFGVLWAKVMTSHNHPDGEWAQRWPLVEITQALPDLRARLARYR